ncbi:MAG TPA: hypothetical protein PKA95_12060 [Thermomicrobiales bacterium]|nr:hypothetical protein [Thermomicrobiales bacterium]
MDRTMTLTASTRHIPHGRIGTSRSEAGARRRATKSVLREIGDAGRWLLLAAAAPELLIEEERALAREIAADGRGHR